MYISLAVLALDLGLNVGGLPPGGLDDLAVLAAKELALHRAPLGHVGLCTCVCVCVGVWVGGWVGGWVCHIASMRRTRLSMILPSSRRRNSPLTGHFLAMLACTCVRVCVRACMCMCMWVGGRVCVP